MTPRPSRPDTTPRIPDIASDLRNRIDEGEFNHVNGKLPSTRNLVTQYKISAQAIARVIALLKAEGVVVGKQGAGVFVRQVDPLRWDLTQFEQGSRRDDVDAGLDDWQASVVAQGRTPEQRILNVTEAPGEVPSKDVARWLGLGPDDLVVARRRLRLVDGVPTQLADSWFPARLALGTPLMDDSDVTMPGGILASIGHPQAKRRDEITPRMPTPEEAKRLSLPPGTAVAQVVRIGYDLAGTAVRAMVTIAPGDRNVLIYEMEA
jgi:GntR family transcriptional regulator